MKIRRSVLIAMLFALCGCAAGPRHPLCILHTNDVHGHISPEPVQGWGKGSGGAAVLAGCVREIRSAGGAAGIPVLLLDAGDIFLGTPEGNLSGGMAVTEVMNAAGYDAMTVGNHEFDLGLEALERLAASARFPLLGANLLSTVRARPPPFIKPYVLRHCGALRVGIIGIITEQTPEVVTPGGAERFRFADPPAIIRACMAELENEGAGFIVLLSHCGIEEDRKLAAEIPGIGVVIGGHSHDLLAKPVRVRSTGTLICQAGGNGQYLGRLEMKIDPARRRVAAYRYEIIPLMEGRCPPDPAVAAIVARWRAAAGAKFEEVVGESLSDFSSSDTGESALGDLIADSMRAATGADAAFTNSLGIRNPLHKGPVTLRGIYMMMPFDNTIYRMRLTGAQLRAALEQGLGLTMGILQVSGLRVEYDPRAPAGRRVLSVSCGGKELDDRAHYMVATNSYLAYGGDSYTAFLKGSEVVNTGVLDRDALASYIRARSPISAEGFIPTRLIPR